MPYENVDLVMEINFYVNMLLVVLYFAIIDHLEIQNGKIIKIQDDKDIQIEDGNHIKIEDGKHQNIR